MREYYALASVLAGLTACTTSFTRNSQSTNTIVAVEENQATAPAAAAPAASASRVSQYDLDGTQEVAIDDDPQLPQGDAPRTLSAWFKTSATDGAHVIANWGTPNVGERFGLLLDNGRVKLVGEFQDIMTASTFADGAWHHAAATFDGKYAVLYVDGAPAVSGFLALDTVGDRLVVGNAPRDHASEYWQGEIADVAIYDRVLDGGEVASLAKI
jgi:hypothetical protein